MAGQPSSGWWYGKFLSLCETCKERRTATLHWGTATGSIQVPAKVVYSISSLSSQGFAGWLRDSLIVPYNSSHLVASLLRAR